jgi:Ca2+-binding EF-hand superfamily protein
MDMKIIEKLKTAKSKEELIEIAKKEGVDIAKDEAEKLFEKFKSSDGKLSFDALKEVAGGIDASDIHFPKMQP